MITSQEIREKSFEKAVFGGYDMASVDEFMEEVANDLALLQKENAVLKGKMKVLVDKVDEYRGNEEVLRNAVLSAQRLGASIEQDARVKSNAMLDEARGKADAILRDARAESDRIVGEISSRLKSEETRLSETRKASAEFIERMNQLCQRQQEFLQRVSEMDFMQQYRAGQKSSAAAPAPAPAQAQTAAPVASSAPVQAPVPVPASAAVQAPPPSQSPATAAHPSSRPAAAPAPGETPGVSEAIRSIGHSVARSLDEPKVNVRPGLSAPVVEDERPTRSFNIVTDPEDDVDKSTQFSLDDFLK